MSKCPLCKSGGKKRISRSLVLRILPKARVYKCYNCKSKYLKVSFLPSPIILEKSKNLN